MADIPITREEKYLAYLTGDYKADVPKPITRQERYLYELCLKGMGGEISPEEIQKAVNDYLDKNPVKPGATTEQAQQIEQNKTDIASLKTETSSLKESISTKITKFYASSQGETHLADSDNGKIMDMMLYGKSEQKQYSGKNLLNATLQTTTSNGVTCTNNNDGTYTLNGTATANAFFSIQSAMQVIAGNTYRFLGIPAGTIGAVYFQFYNGDGYTRSVQGGTNFEAKQEELDIGLYVDNGDTVSNLIIKPMIVDAEKYPDATYDDFEPYTGGIPSPNPSCPQEIKSVVNPTVKIYDLKQPNFILRKIPKISDGSLTTSENYLGSTEPIFVSPDEKYVYKLTADGSEIRSTYVMAYSKKNYLGYLGYSKYIEGIGFNKIFEKYPNTKYIVLRYDAQAKYADVFFNIYTKEQTVTLPYTLNAIPVSSGGNVTIDGQQYASDYFDVERGKLVRNVLVAKLTGAEDWTYSDANDDSKKRFYLVIGEKIKIKVGMSNYLRNAGNAILAADNCFAAYSKSFDVRITSIASLAEFKNLLGRLNSSGNPLDIFLALDTPKEIDLTSEEVQALKALATYYPTTNISVNSEQLDGYTVFNYPVSMENGWNYVKQQIGDTREYIYDMDTRTQDTDLQAAEAYVNSEYAVALTELEV